MTNSKKRGGRVDEATLAAFVLTRHGLHARYGISRRNRPRFGRPCHGQ